MDEATLLDGGPSGAAVLRNHAFISTTADSQFPIMDDGAAAGAAPEYIKLPFLWSSLLLTPLIPPLRGCPEPAALDRH